MPAASPSTSSMRLPRTFLYFMPQLHLHFASVAGRLILRQRRFWHRLGHLHVSKALTVADIGRVGTRSFTCRRSGMIWEPQLVFASREGADSCIERRPHEPRNRTSRAPGMTCNNKYLQVHPQLNLNDPRREGFHTDYSSLFARCPLPPNCRNLKRPGKVLVILELRSLGRPLAFLCSRYLPALFSGAAPKIEPGGG